MWEDDTWDGMGGGGGQTVLVEGLLVAEITDILSIDLAIIETLEATITDNLTINIPDENLMAAINDSLEVDSQ